MSRIRLSSVIVIVLAALLGGGIGPAAPVALAAAPDFSLSASPPSIDLSAGGFATTAVTVTPSGGFAGAVALSVGALPAGVTARLVPVPASGGATTDVQLSATSSVTTTVTTLTVTGTSGSLSHSLAIPLTVAGFVSDFAVFVNPPSLTLAAGSSATATVGGTPAGRAPVFAVAGLPAGVTATFGPTTVTPNGGSTATLTLTAAGGAPPARARLLVTGTAGAVSASAALSLTVTAAARRSG